MSQVARPRRIGALGTLVWDTIHAREGHRAPVTEWGGMAYALEALAVGLPEGCQLVPIVKVGRDLSESALRYLRGLPGVDLDSGIRIVPEANNRVELRYLDGVRRTERLEGGVPPWIWPELAPIARSCDALYVNFISGFEMGLDTARSLRSAYRGPCYADLHSLFMGITRQGLRTPRELPAWGSWLRCFDAVQMNEAEFELLGQAWGDPWRLAAEVVGAELKLVTVTLGERGSAYVAGAGFTPDPSEWPRVRHAVGVAGPTVSGRVAVEGGARVGDPTGCGDVWGATFFARLLAGDSLEGAMTTANEWAARNVAHRGARGLGRHLLGRIANQPENP